MSDLPHRGQSITTTAAVAEEDGLDVVDANVLTDDDNDAAEDDDVEEL